MVAATRGSRTGSGRSPAAGRQASRLVGLEGSAEATACYRRRVTAGTRASIPVARPDLSGREAEYAAEAAITARTRGLIAVHHYGHPADMDALTAVADRHGLWVVEYAAEAHGARYRGRRVGGLGSIGTFSFYGNKIMSSGEGGALTV